MAIIHFPRKADLLVEGNFNLDMAALEGYISDKEITMEMAASVLEGMSAHFLLWHKTFS